MKSIRLTALLITFLVVLGISAVPNDAAALPLDSSGWHKAVERSGGVHHIVGQDDAMCGDADGCDSERLQAALDAAEPGAKLVLEGVFDFGDDQFVSLKKDVTIKGKRGPDGEYLAIIKGGMNAFALGWDPALGLAEYDEACNLVSNPNTSRWPAEFVIEDLQFESPTWSAITGAATTGVTIRRNRFIDGLVFGAGCNTEGIPGYEDGESHAIRLIGLPDARHPVFGVPSDMSGQILIDGNYFDSKVRMDPEGYPMAHGFPSMMHGRLLLMNGMTRPIIITEVEADITVRRNEFENTHWSGVYLSDNVGTLSVEKNSIIMDPADQDGNPIGYGWAAISVRNWTEGSFRAPVLIEKNYIYQRLRDNMTGAIQVRSGAAVIRKNTIEQDQAPDVSWPAYAPTGGIYVNDAQNTRIEKNTIQGTGNCAIVVAPTDSSGNVVVKNDVSGFTPQDAPDPWCRLFGGQNCPIGAVGAHYYLAAGSADNIIVDKMWHVGMTLIDETSDHNPYDPETYNGDNIIRLGK